MTDPNTNLADDTTDDEDSDLLLDTERNTGESDASVLPDEASAIEEEVFSEPEGLKGPNSDIGNFDEETGFAEILEEGAGDDKEDITALGMHVEEFADESIADDDADDLEDDETF